MKTSLDETIDVLNHSRYCFKHIENSTTVFVCFPEGVEDDEVAKSATLLFFKKLYPICKENLFD
jgi:hypothetical protein